MKSRVAIFFALLLMVLAWWLWPRTVELDKSQYAIAIALYRVCNQASEEGLSNIETLIEDSSDDSSDGGMKQIQAIIAQARSGQWQAATKACRGLLDDQVR